MPNMLPTGVIFLFARTQLSNISLTRSMLFLLADQKFRTSAGDDQLLTALVNLCFRAIQVEARFESFSYLLITDKTSIAFLAVKEI